MELPFNTDESVAVNDTIEQIDTWNQPRSDEALRSFVTSRMVRIADLGDLVDDFDLAA